MVPENGRYFRPFKFMYERVREIKRKCSFTPDKISKKWERKLIKKHFPNRIIFQCSPHKNIPQTGNGDFTRTKMNPVML